MEKVLEATKQLLETPETDLRRRALLGDELALDVLLFKTRLAETNKALAAATEAVHRVCGTKAGG